MKEKPMVSNDRDVEYTLDFGGDTEEEYEEDVSRSLVIKLQQHRPQYIAHMSISTYANSTKYSRVSAPSLSRMCGGI